MQQVFMLLRHEHLVPSEAVSLEFWKCWYSCGLESLWFEQFLPHSFFLTWLSKGVTSICLLCSCKPTYWLSAISPFEHRTREENKTTVSDCPPEINPSPAERQDDHCEASVQMNDAKVWTLNWNHSAKTLLWFNQIAKVYFGNPCGDSAVRNLAFENDVMLFKCIVFYYCIFVCYTVYNL